MKCKSAYELPSAERFSAMTVKNFTLIELLIVIAVIAILVSLLLPALNSAKTKARTIGCVNNQKQINTYLLNYVGDNSDYFPARLARYSGIKLSGYLWRYYSSKSMGTGWGQERCTKNDNPLEIPFKPFMCPGYPGFGQIATPDSNGWRSWSAYASNVFIIDDTSYGATYPRVNQVPHPSQAEILMDYYGKTNSNATHNHSAGDSYVSANFPHSRRRNVLFIDGHVMALKYGQVPFSSSFRAKIFYSTPFN